MTAQKHGRGHEAQMRHPDMLEAINNPMRDSVQCVFDRLLSSFSYPARGCCTPHAPMRSCSMQGGLRDCEVERLY